MRELIGNKLGVLGTGMEKDKSALYQLKSRRKGRVLCMFLLNPNAPKFTPFLGLICLSWCNCGVLPSLLAELAQQKSLRFHVLSSLTFRVYYSRKTFALAVAILRAARSESTGMAGSASFSHRQGLDDCVTATHASLSGSSHDSSHTKK
jgi:hypothetical protein